MLQTVLHSTTLGSRGDARRQLLSLAVLLSVLLLAAPASPSFGQGRGAPDGVRSQVTNTAAETDPAVEPQSKMAKALTTFTFGTRGYLDGQILIAPLLLSKGDFTLVFEDRFTSILDFEYKTSRTGDLNYQASGQLEIRTDDDSEFEIQSIDLGFTDSNVGGSDITITGYRDGSQVAETNTTAIVGGVNTTVALSSSDSGFANVDRVDVKVNSIAGGDGITAEFTTFDNVAIDDPTAANTAPTVATNTGSTVNEGSNDTITQSELETTDSEQGASSLTYTIDTDVTEGELYNGSTQIDQSDTFTQADVNNGDIEYRHDGSEPVSGVSFDFTVADGAGGSDSGTFSFTINPVNDAPTISDISDQTITEDGTLSSLSFTVGDTETSDLSTLTLSGASDNTTLVPNSGITVTGPDASGNASVTVQPAYNESGTATITVTVDDGAVANNTASDSFVLTVSAVPDLTITDGSASGLDYTSTLSPGTDENPVGIFELSAGQSGAAIDAVTVTNNAPGIAGISGASLFWSDDQSLGAGDTKLDDVAVDASNAPSTITFGSFTQSIPTSARYAILTIDVEAGASDDVQFELAQTSDLSVTNGEIATVNGTSQSTFSALPLSKGATALPVELASFDASLENEAVVLTWNTASETNNAGFDVQRKESASAADGTDEEWASVGQIEGSGTTTDANRYRFEDTRLPYEAEVLTYRLRQVDTDGSVSYSEAITVDRAAVEQVKLLGTYPNPARERATVRFALPESSAGHGVSLRLYDVMGRQVHTVEASPTAGRHELQLQTDQLPSGVYFLRLRAGTTVETQRLTVVQ